MSLITVNLYDLETFSIGTAAAQTERDDDTRFERMASKFERQGMRRSVHACLLVHLHNHPHVLLLLRKSDNTFFLPGGTLKPDEGDIDGLCRKLSAKLASVSLEPPRWDVVELLGQLWRPEFDESFYPYVPPHVAKPKESKKVFLVSLPEKCVFAVPTNYRLTAVPLFEIHTSTNMSTDIAALPLWLSRVRCLCD